MPRHYDRIAAEVARRAQGDRQSRMRTVADALWDALHNEGVSWVGFYLPEGDDAMTLGPSRNKPACSPIGLHGACGQAFTSRRTLIVRDVAELGEGYIACDPRDRSEVVIPCFDEDGSCWGVLDVDSHDLASFGETDAEGMQRVLRAAGLTAKATTPGEIAGRRD